MKFLAYILKKAFISIANYVFTLLVLVPLSPVIIIAGTAIDWVMEQHKQYLLRGERG